MPDRIEGDGFILKVLNQRPLEVRVRSALKARIESLDDYFPAPGLTIARYKDLRVAPATQALAHLIATIYQTIFQLQFRHIRLRNAECGMRNADLIRRIPFSFRIPHSAF